MAYSDKVQAELASAQETAIANKIIDMMQNLKLKNDNTTACRWIWELIQNAKDVVNSTGSINIVIDFNEEERYLSFKHDGKCFTTKNMVHLISQVSSKDRVQTADNGVTGKFGTGFLTTHLLSEKVMINALLQDGNEYVKEINVLLDRSGETREEVISAVKKSFTQLEDSVEVSASAIEEHKGFNTCFLYELDRDGVEIAKNGIESLCIAVPYVFSFIEKINSITINDSIYFKRENINQYGDMNIHTIKEIENGESCNYNILHYHKENVDLAIPVKIEGDTIIVEEYPPKIPKLYCDFPLIGTEEFCFPVVINSSCFNPNEPRNGIYLTDKEDKVVNENKKLMLQALNMYKKMLNYAVAEKWKHIYNIVSIPRQPQKEWISREWLRTNIIEKCKDYIKQAEIFETVSGDRKSLFDWQGYQDIFIISDHEELSREQVWKLTKSIYPERIVLCSEVHKWYASLWNECRNFNMHKLIETVESFGSLEALDKEINDISAIDWLNSLYEVIELVEDKENYKIYPNQVGIFCFKQELYVDDGIEDIYKEILDLLGNDCRGRLFDNSIRFPDQMGCQVYNYIKLFNEIDEALTNDSVSSYSKALAKLVVLYDDESKDDNEQLQLLDFWDTLFKDEKIESICRVYKINIDVMDKVKNYWCTEIANKVSACATIEVLEKQLNLSDGYDVWCWIKNFIEYLGKYKHKNLLERKTKPILPNQNGKFINIETIFLDSGEIDELFKDILLETGNDIRSILLPVEIYIELPESREKGLRDISRDIIEYVKDNQGKMKNQNDTVREYFNKLFLWINDNSDKARLYFKEILENKHWLYNDEEIAENMKKAERYDDLMKKYNIDDVGDLETALQSYSKISTSESEDEEMEISEEFLIQYGIASEEDFQEAKKLNVFKENFLHISESDVDKFAHVSKILERAKKTIFSFLDTLDEYDVTEPLEISKTIFIIKKHEKEIVLITRPSDSDQVILYYGAEKDILDFEKDYELWVEDGKSKPQQITFGKMLKLTGINRIPLRKVR